MKYFFLIPLFIFQGLCTQAQTLTTPNFEGFTYHGPVKVHFPFNIQGISFKSIPNSVWHTGSRIIALLDVSWKYKDRSGTSMEQYRQEAVVDVNGNWHMNNMTVDVPAFNASLSGFDKNSVTYMLSVWQEYGGNISARHMVDVQRDNYRALQVKKIKKPSEMKKRVDPIKKSSPQKTISKRALNPQPAPPKNYSSNKQ